MIKNFLKKSFFITNNGCIRRKIDAQHIFNFLIRNGYYKVDTPENADLLFFVSCASDNSSEAVAINAILDLEKRRKPKGKIYVIGCLSKINPEALKDIKGIMGMIGPSDMSQLDTYFPNTEISFKEIPEPYRISKEIFTRQDLKYGTEDLNEKLIERNPFKDNLSINDPVSQYEAFKSKSNVVRIARGCLSSCAYCCIRRATGRLKSRSLNDILEQLRNILVDNSPYMTITAEDVGAYGLDIGTNLSKLLSSIVIISNHVKLAINAFNPRWILPVLDELEMVLNDTHMLKHVVAPIQSGSDYVLSMMNRGHTVDDGKRFFEVLEKFEDLQIHTHLIIGFPGERPIDVDDTIKLIRRFPKINYYVYPYNDRPGTISSNFKNKLSNDEIQSRFIAVMEAKMEKIN